MKVKNESEKAGLKLNIQKTKIMASGPISSVQFSCSVMYESFWPHESPHIRPPCESVFGTPKNKVWHGLHCFPIYFPWSDGTRCHDLRFLTVEL